MAITTTCRKCGAELEADARSIAAGTWRTCTDCLTGGKPPEHPKGGQCRECGRHLRDPRRHLCLRCAGISVS
ncbi:MAG: hypothetical protein QOJ59_572 [Thermomicrobiales bacterium]|jgi:hypothetical protein|nr:hypothetical protein [Thermomicrobiales bacterium]